MRLHGAAGMLMLLSLACSARGTSSIRSSGAAVATTTLAACGSDAGEHAADAGVEPDPTDGPDDSPVGAIQAAPLGPAIATIQDFSDFAGNACPGDSTSGTSFACSRGTNDPAFPSMLALRGSGLDPAQFLRLASVTPVGAYDNNTIAFPTPAPGAFPVIVADFDFRLAPVQDRGRADGFGFALLNTANYRAGPVPPTAVAEEPSFAGSIGLGFDLYKNDGDIGNANITPTFSDSVSIHHDGQVIGQVDLENVTDIGNGQWHHARVVVRQTGAGTSLSLLLTPPCGDSFTVIDNLAIPGAAPFEARAWFGARSSGEATNQDLANVRVNFLPADASWISFGASRYLAEEPQGGVALTVTREGDLSAPVTVTYATRDLTATAGADYLAASGTVTFEPGQTQQTIVVPLIDDDQDETTMIPPPGRAELTPDVSESFQVTLTSLGANAQVAGPAVARVVIFDDEGSRIHGHWGRQWCAGIIATHAHLMPATGDLLYWDRLGNVASWSPSSGLSRQVDGPGYDLFCAGHALLPDGTLLVSGGHDDPLGASEGHDGVGVNNLSVFDPASAQPWHAAPAMSGSRWYPTVTTLSDGRALLISGSLDTNYDHNLLPEVYDPQLQTLQELTGATDAAPHGVQLYPFMFALPGGRVAKVGPDPDGWLLDTNGAGAWTRESGSPDGLLRDYGSAVLINHAAIVLGGGGADPGGPAPTNLVSSVDLDTAPWTWSERPPMNIGRRQHNATVLPDGRVVVTGGSSAPGFSNIAGSATAAEVFDGQAWTMLPAAAVARGYHHTALLLPDGRVISAGGGEGAGLTLFQNNVEVYYPDYWFKARPELRGAPAEIAHDQPFALGSSATIARVTAIRVPSVTHSFNQNQRFIELPFQRTPEGVLVTVAGDGWVPPGHYLLFVLDPDDVPSRGAIVHVHP
jgi:hypothetical protein